MTTSDFDVVVIGSGIVGSVLAAGLADRGYRIALVERGGQTDSDQVIAKPIVECSMRMHTGCFQARNHVLGGNGYYWGGGLVRPPEMGLWDCLGIPGVAQENAESLALNFRNVEELLGVRRPPVRVPFPAADFAVGSVHLSEIAILPGKVRNISSILLAKFARIPSCETLTCTEVDSFASNTKNLREKKVASVIVNKGGELRELAARSYVIAAGGVDSNVLVLSHAQQFGLDGKRVGLGTRLHDHFSVPIARVRLSANSELKDLLAPHFRNGLVIGRRFELQCETGWGAKGFLHFALQFDNLSPYREIRQLMLLRQQGSSFLHSAKASMPLFAVSPDLLRIVFERLVKKRLYLADDLAICATIDFETFPHPANAMRLIGDRVDFAWSINQEDEISFLELLHKANQLFTELSRSYGMQVESIKDFSSPSNAIAHLHAAATDAFHLGGGVAAGVDGEEAVDQNLRLVGTDNVYVVSSAVLRRPGVVNPTHTLLALADRFVNQHQMET